MELKGNTILITGGTSGIGKGLAEEFYKLGNKVIICGRRQNRIDEITAMCPGMTGKKVDLSIENDRIELAEWVLANYPDVNVLINNAGVQNGVKIGNDLNLKKIHEEVDVNIIAPVHLSSLFIDHLEKKERAVIINVSSGLAFVPLAFLPIYCATKAALHSISLSMRYQLIDKGIKVFEVLPPAVNTELGQDRSKITTPSHGGISVDEFIKDTMEALKNNEFEAAIGTAKNLREKREMAFNHLNS